MQVIHQRCAGLDVHKETVVACIRIAADATPVQHVQTFATTTSGLLALADWLSSYETFPRRLRVLQVAVDMGRERSTPATT
jgi:hypothetical protein